jgi:hypothetical protein
MLTTQLQLLGSLLSLLRSELSGGNRGERGMTTETVIITAVLAALAIAVTAIIVAKVTNKAENIPTE